MFTSGHLFLPPFKAGPAGPPAGPPAGQAPPIADSPKDNANLDIPQQDVAGDSLVGEIKKKNRANVLKKNPQESSVEEAVLKRSSVHGARAMDVL